MSRKRGRTMTKYVEVDAEVDIEFEDVRDYISDYATSDELKIIADDLKENYLDQVNVEIKTLEDQMKYELLMMAFSKYNLTQLEEKLGTKFDLM